MEGYRRPPGGLSEDFRRACEGISRGAHKGLAEETGSLLQGSRHESYGKDAGGLPEATADLPARSPRALPADTREIPEDSRSITEGSKSYIRGRPGWGIRRPGWGGGKEWKTEG